MRRWMIAVTFVAGAGCLEPDPGTSVGNPNLTLVKVAPPGPGLTLDLASLPIAAVQVSNSDGTRDAPVPSSTDVLKGAPLDLPAGDWTELSLVVDGRFVVQGVDGDGEVDLELELDEVAVRSLRSPLQFDEPHVFELAFPEWLTADNVGWTAGDDHVVRPGDPVHDVLADFVESRSAFLADPDGDGEPNR